MTPAPVLGRKRPPQTPVSCEPATKKTKHRKAISTRGKTTANKKSILLAIPLEVRERIYEFACEETIGRSWTERRNNINPGRSLLLVSRQIHDESKPFVYRTLTITANEPTKDLFAAVGSSNRVNYTRRVEIHFNCFCETPVNGCNSVPYRPPYGNDYHRELVHWSAALRVVKSLPLVEELRVTFDTCCRRPLDVRLGAAIPHLTAQGVNPTTLPYHAMNSTQLRKLLGLRGYCVSLENFFLVVMDDSDMLTYLDKLIFRGDVPPSCLIHLLKPTEDGRQLKLHYMSQALCNYIQDREAATLAEEGLAIPSPDALSADHTKMAYPKEGTLAILVSAGRKRKVALWESHIGQEWSGMPKEGDYPFMKVLEKKRAGDDLEMSLDYTESKPVPVSEASVEEL